MAQQESTTPVWFALQLSATGFGIFDAFSDEAGRQAHLNGPVARLTSTGRSRRHSARTLPSCWRKRRPSNASTCSAPSCPAEVRLVNHMNQTGNSMKQQKSDASVTRVALNLEVHIIPVSDVDRSKQFYQLLGWRLDEDVAPAKNVRVVQFTPPGSGCSVNFGNGLTAAAPGSAAAALIVSDIKAAHDELICRGIDASEMWHGAPFPLEARLPGPDPKRTSYGSFFAFSDPDGNAWLVQEVTTRRPGRI
jgi:catechol 2,3-dioxygenase-like lactoylglutathione lyase family enzyme